MGSNTPEYSRKYYLKNKERINELNKLWYYRNRDKSLGDVELWRVEHPISIKDTRERTLRIGNKRITIPMHFRTGVCSICGNIPSNRRTCIRHDGIVDYDNPLKNSKEVCMSCHARLSFQK